MKIISGIVNTFKHNKTKLLTGAMGLAGLGVIGYDSHYVGKLQSDLYASERDAKNAIYYLNNDMYNTGMSKVEDKVRDFSYNMELGTNWKRFINTGIGYVKGFTSMLVSSIVPLTLSLGAIFAPKKAAKWFAGGLGIYGAYAFLKNFFGWSTPGDPLTK
jgi:hypothetical protein